MQFFQGKFTTFLQNIGQNGNGKVVKYQELYLSDTSVAQLILSKSLTSVAPEQGWVIFCVVPP